MRKAGLLKCEGDIWQLERKWIKDKVFAMICRIERTVIDFAV